MPALDQQTFNVWREADDQFKDEIRQHIRAQQTINLDFEGRISTVAESQRTAGEQMNKRVTWLSAVISAIVGALTAAGLAAANSRLP